MDFLLIGKKYSVGLKNYFNRKIQMNLRFKFNVRLLKEDREH
jgi:hypothetical protein